MDTAHDRPQQCRHLFVGRGRELREDDPLSICTLPIRAGGEDAIDGRGVEVQVEAQASAEALDHRDAPALPRLDAEPAGAATVEAEQGPHVDLQHRAAELVVICEAIAKRVGQAENPLAHRSTRKDLIDQVGGALRHAAAATAGAKAAALAREGHQLLLAARATAQPSESVAQYAAPQKAAQLTSDEAGYAPPFITAGRLEESGQVPPKDLVQHPSLGFARSMKPRRAPRRDGNRGLHHGAVSTASGAPSRHHRLPVP